MTKFTPGEWDIHENETLEIHPLWDEDGEYIVAEIPKDASGNKQANARLIASAPRMYELLAMTLDRIHEDPIDHISAEALIEDIRTTITSIKGGHND